MYENLSFRSSEVSFQQRDHIESHLRQNPHFKGAYIRTQLRVLYLNQLNIKQRFNLCQQEFTNIPVVIYTPKNFYLSDEINRNLLFLRDSGLVWYWRYQAINLELANFKDKKIRRKLNYGSLKGCFQILMVGFSLSSLVFTIEVLVNKLMVKKEILRA